MGTRTRWRRRWRSSWGRRVFVRPTRSGEYADFDWFVIGGPVYGESLDPRLIDFVAGRADWLRRKKIALFCTCLTLEAGERYLQPLRAILGAAVVWARPIGGNIALNRLLEEDLAALESFCDAVGLPFQDISRFDAELTMQQALQIKALRDADGRRAPADVLKGHIERFLTEHNTCALTTGFGERVRGTPVEYSYSDGCLYILSEGGAKFANILLNRHVSVSIYDPYTGMDTLAGLQMAGDAHVVSAGGLEYLQALEMKGLDPERVAGLPMALNLLRIRLSHAEFLWLWFVDMGYEARQYFDF